MPERIETGDRTMMGRALTEAWERTGLTSPNPPVGAVIAREGRVLSVGGTRPCGSSHAEVVALEAAPDPRGADMYVTLEPCSHYGRTPPCTEAIIRAGIARLFCPVMDPNPLVSGRGFAALREAGVRVEIMKDMAEQAVDIVRPFRKSIMRKRPFVIYKWAAGVDGRTATKEGDSRWISCDRSRLVAHRLRAKCDAVIVGKKTFECDNPALTVRFDDFLSCDTEGPECGRAMIGRENYFLRSLLDRRVKEYNQPLRVLAGLPAGVTGAEPFFHDGNHAVYVSKKVAAASGGATPAGVNLVILDAVDRRDFIDMMLADLDSRGVVLAMLEGGGTLAGEFFDSGNIDQYMYCMAPRILGAGTPSLSASGAPLVASAARLFDQSAAMVDGDLFYTAYAASFNFEQM